MTETPAATPKGKQASLLYRDGIKALCHLLACLLLIASLFSIISVILLSEFGFYTGTFEATQREVYTHFGQTTAEQTLRAVYDEVYDPVDPNYSKIDEYDAAINAELLRRFSAENVLLTISDPGGRIIASAYRGEEVQYEGEISLLLYGGEDKAPVERFVHFVIPVEKQGSGLFYIMDLWLAQVYGQRFALIAIGFISFLLFSVLFVMLLGSSGRHVGEEAPRLSVFDRLPTDLMLALYAIYGGLLTELILRVTDSWKPVLIVPAALLILIASPLFLLFCCSFATRCKCGTLLKNTVCFRILYWFWRGIDWFWRHALCPVGRTIHQVIAGMPIVWKTALVLFVISFVEFFALWFIPTRSALLICWLVETLVFSVVILAVALIMRRLQAGGQALAKGDLQYKIDERHMPSDFKQHAKDLNSISEGMSRAVEERMKSEHFRTELISNVSHDIKTPLTNIISYINLLQQEPYASEAAQKYLMTLDRQSTRLKKLMEDLLEISKASTGNMNILTAPCELEVLLSQALGEYEERMTKADLMPVLHIASPSTVILADGQLLWRVFDNLLSNIVKYAMPGTRVYLNLTQEKGYATLLLRNISKEELNVPVNDLLERFVRGDRSRHTEGSGLGLSIAQSLTELMGGELSLEIDGDLFKVTLRFPLYVKE
ncbi:MAG: HAMP domain-containing histidine kinase [Clostridia bacterium]|nr:HAMP domain-containing histidine kinase [Clostridia bacterium]